MDSIIYGQGYEVLPLKTPFGELVMRVFDGRVWIGTVGASRPIKVGRRRYVLSCFLHAPDFTWDGDNVLVSFLTSTSARHKVEAEFMRTLVPIVKAVFDDQPELLRKAHRNRLSLELEAERASEKGWQQKALHAQEEAAKAASRVRELEDELQTQQV